MNKTSNKSLLILVIISIGLSVFNFIKSKSVKIACIDSAKVLQSYNGIKELSKNLEEKNKQLKSKLDTLESDFKASLQAFEKKRTTLSASDIQKEETLLRKKQEQYTQFNVANQEGLKQQEMKIIEKALEKINEKIKRYALKEGYIAVFATTPNGGIAYVSESIDITEDVIKIINN